MKQIQPGLSAEKKITVTAALGAVQMGSGRLEVYATPAMVALMEAAAVAAIEPLLAEGQASVGVDLAVKHLAATPIGQQVRAKAVVTGVDGRQVRFALQAWDEREQIGAGTHTRYVIDIKRFEQRVRSKADR
jgi:fluoroacetyl-CoA thioesterase